MHPSQPIRLAARVSATAWPVPMAAVPASSGRRPATCSHATSNSRMRSSSASENHSPVLPATMMPWAPSSICASMTLRNAASSIVPSSVNGVTTGGNTPFQSVRNAAMSPPPENNPQV